MSSDYVLSVYCELTNDFVVLFQDTFLHFTRLRSTMKRTAAVLGPTPPFIRWAIKKQCELRELDVENLADQTFRQLRNVRALSNGYRENRVFEDICVHPAPIGETATVRAFPTSEVFDFIGDAASLASCCGECSANCLATMKTDWAGCFGLLPVNLNYTFGHTSQAQVLPVDDLITLVDETMGNEHDFYRLWTQKWISEDKAAELARIFKSISLQRNGNLPLTHFTDACRRCDVDQMQLYAELVPSGFSDGIHWKLNRACEVCRFESQTPRDKGTPCPVCKARHADDFGRKAKVLGLRPYLRLERVLGPTQTQEFIQRYQLHRRKSRAIQRH